MAGEIRLDYLGRICFRRIGSSGIQTGDGYGVCMADADHDM